LWGFCTKNKTKNKQTNKLTVLLNNMHKESDIKIYMSPSTIYIFHKYVSKG